MTAKEQAAKYAKKIDCDSCGNQVGPERCWTCANMKDAWLAGYYAAVEIVRRHYCDAADDMEGADYKEFMDAEYALVVLGWTMKRLGYEETSIGQWVRK
jgi:hypothetical protein